jgi:ABC-type polar amino acid transport system ATPase subunit
MNNVAIEAVGVVKRFGSKFVLSGVNLEIAQGEVAVVIGASGCGKSTFLRCLNGLESFQDGTIRIGNTTLTSSDHEATRERTLLSLRREVGMVFQGYNLFPHRSVLQNVTDAPIHVLGLSKEEAEARAVSLLKRVGLAEWILADPSRLSGGQKQRVAIARTLAMEPSVILFDEPTSALDPMMAGEVLSVMTDLAGSGKTMVVVTHSMGFARRVAHSVHFFHEGTVVESAPPAEFFGDPKTESARTFVAKALAA